MLTGYTLPGWFAVSQAETVKAKLEGKGKYNFIVMYSGFQENQKIRIYTEDRNVDEKEFQESVIYSIICEL